MSRDRDPSDDVCDEWYTDVYVVPADGSAPGRRLLAESHPSTRVNRPGTARGSSSGPALRSSGGFPVESGLWVAEVTDPDAPWGLDGRRLDHQEKPVWGRSNLRPGRPTGPESRSTWWSKDGGYGIPIIIPEDGGDALTLWTDASVRRRSLPRGARTGRRSHCWSCVPSCLTTLIYQLYVMSSDGTEPRLVDTPDLTGNAGPAMFSPDGTKLLVRLPRGPMPGDIAVVRARRWPRPGRALRERQWSTMDWQPVVNPDNPASTAPEGLPVSLTMVSEATQGGPVIRPGRSLLPRSILVR